MSILHGWQTASESRHARAHLSPRNNSSVSSHRNVFPQDARVIDVEGDLFCFTCRSDVTHAREMGDVKLLPLNVYLERCRLHFLPRGKTQWDTNSRNLVVPAPTCKLRKKKKREELYHLDRDNVTFRGLKIDYCRFSSGSQETRIIQAI